MAHLPSDSSKSNIVVGDGGQALPTRVLLHRFRHFWAFASGGSKLLVLAPFGVILLAGLGFAGFKLYTGKYYATSGAKAPASSTRSTSSAAAPANGAKKTADQPSTSPSPTGQTPPKTTAKSGGSSGGSSAGGSSGGGSSGGSSGGGSSSGGTTSSCALPKYPDATCTGVPAGTTLTSASSVTLSTPGQVYDSKDVTGCITVTAANVTIKNSRVKCNDSYGIWSRSTGLLIQDTEVDCINTTGTGIVGGSFTARRVNVHGCENGASADDNVTIADSYIHDLYEGPGSHVDGIQVATDSTGLVFDHNRILNPNSETSAIIGGDNATETVSNNFLAGGGFTLYCSPNFAGFKVFNNRFSRQYWPNGGYYGPYANCDGIGQWSNNVWDDTGLPV